jgi:hypothetical protein
MANTGETRRSTQTHLQNVRIPFADLTEPGTYVNERSGELFRVPEDALVAGRSPLIEIVSDHPTMLTKLSDNAWIPISKARQLAADSDMNVAF